MALQMRQLTSLLTWSGSLASRWSQAWRAKHVSRSLLNETQVAPGVERPNRIQLSREALLDCSNRMSWQRPGRLHSREEEEAEVVASLPLHNTRRG